MRYLTTMNRLPIRLEQEVLSKHGIEWHENDGFNPDGLTPDTYNKWSASRYVSVSPYEIAGIALEAIMLEYYGFYYHIKDEAFTCIGKTDKDFCECIFKAIREVYKDED